MRPGIFGENGMSTDASTLSSSMAFDRSRPRAKPHVAGSLIVAASAIAFSTAGLFTRLIAVDVWTMLFWRGVFGGLLILAFIIWREGRGTPSAFAAIGRVGLLAAGCSTAATICFITALRATTVAEVTVIYATAPFIAAAVAWLWTSERPDRTTLAASALALLGVVAMCGVAFAGGNLLGDLLALCMTVLMAVMMVAVRQSRHVSMLPAACLSALACSIAVLPLSHPATVTALALLWLGLFGTTQFGLGLLLLTIGTRRISATRASLLGNLELPFAPLWVWLAFGETPPWPTYLGGGIVCGAVFLDLLADQRRMHQPA
jgi:drug/metabolite transporter (DMT)-like permease